MTEERETTDADRVSDPLVTRIYRESADERAPASINETVLRQAQARAGGGYSRGMLWLRPLAWAASIGLCLAIVLELSLSPVGSPGMGEVAELESLAVREDAVESPAVARSNVPANQELARELSEQVANMDDVASDEVQKVLRDEQQRPESKVETFEEAPQLAAESPSPERRLQPQSQILQQSAPPVDSPDEDALNVAAFGSDVGRQSELPATADADAAVAGLVEREMRSAPDIGPDSESATQEQMLEEIALASRARSADGRLDDPAAAGSTSLFSTSASAESDAMPASPLCRGDAVSTPESWLDCIEQLEEMGYEDEAREQRRLLDEAFPEFGPVSE